MVKLMLNLKKPNTYAFFCPVSKLHLTVSNPVGQVNEVTPDILSALKFGKLIDVDKVVDIQKESERLHKKPNKVNVVPKTQAAVTASPVESTESKVAEAPVEPVAKPEETAEAPVEQETAEEVNEVKSEETTEDKPKRTTKKK